MIKTIINPDIYHGKGRNDNFFEGWYFKIVTPDINEVFAFIPGIMKSGKPELSESFIQVLRGCESKLDYIKYAPSDFLAEEDRFSIKVGESTFSLEGMNLKLKGEGFSIRGSLVFKNIVRWPDSLLNPGSMGFYNYLTFMQCYSQVCALTCDAEGFLEINGEHKDFSGGKVYIEKNWGRDFPYAYIWVQCNSFLRENASLTCSIAHIPFLFTSFTGFLIGMYWNGEFYKFTTINRSSLTLDKSSSNLQVEARNSLYTLLVSASTKPDEFMLLYAPREDRMIPIAEETLLGNIKVTLRENKSKRLLFEDTGILSGVEFCGTYMNLIERKM